MGVYACCILFVMVANQGEVANALPLPEGAEGFLDSGPLLSIILDNFVALPFRGSASLCQPQANAASKSISGLSEFLELPAGQGAAIAAAEKAAILVAQKQAAQLQANGGEFVHLRPKAAQEKAVLKFAKATKAVTKPAAAQPKPTAKAPNPAQKIEQAAAEAQKAADAATKAAAVTAKKAAPKQQKGAKAAKPSGPAITDEVRADGTIVQHVAVAAAGKKQVAEKRLVKEEKEVKKAPEKKAAPQAAPKKEVKKAAPKKAAPKHEVKKAAPKKAAPQKAAPKEVQKAAPKEVQKAAPKAPAAPKKAPPAAKKAPPVGLASAPAHSTEKVWADMASDAEVMASANEFYAKQLNSMTKTEAGFSGLLKGEKETAVSASKLNSQVKDVLGTFQQKPKAKKAAPKKAAPKEEDTDLGEGDELLAVPTPSEMAASAEAAAQKMVAKEHLSAKMAKPAKQAVAPQKVEVTLKADAEARLATEEKEAQVIKPKKVQKGVATARPANVDEAKQASVAQAVQAVELAKAAKVAKEGAATQKLLKSEQKEVATLKADKKKENAEAAQKANKALNSEIDTHKKLSSALQSISDSAHVNEQAQAKLYEKAQDVRRMSTLETNIAEQELDALSQKTGSKKEELGESQAPNTGSFSQAVVNYEHEMNVQEGKVSAIVKMGQKIDVDTAKVQEDQHQAAEASSKVQIEARMLSKSLTKAGQHIAKMQRQKTSTAQLKEELQELKAADKQTMEDVVRLKGDATNAAADEAAGVSATKAEVSQGALLLKSIATDLLPAQL